MNTEGFPAKNTQNQYKHLQRKQQQQQQQYTHNDRSLRKHTSGNKLPIKQQGQ